MTAFVFDRDFAHRVLAPVHADSDDVEVLRERSARVVWSHVTEPGDGVAGRLIAARGAADALHDVLVDAPWPAEFRGRERRDARKRWMPRLSREAIEHSIRLAQRASVSLLVPSDAAWPDSLGDLGPHAPACLWVRGDAEMLAGIRPGVAIVGARAATSYGENQAMEIAGDLGQSAITVVSGGAYGIDGAAHRAALTVGGFTVALLAGGVDRAYPSGHTELLEKVVSRGAVASEVPPGSTPTKWRFLQRNRLIAALSHATVVVEAGWRSGSLNTAGHAVSLGRPLGAVPGPVTSAASAGCHRLLREYGAECITGAQDVRSMLGMPDPASETPEGRTDDYTRVIDALSGRAWRDSADVARRSGMLPEEVEAMLGLLSLDARVVSSSAGWRLAVHPG